MRRDFIEFIFQRRFEFRDDVHIAHSAPLEKSVTISWRSQRNINGPQRKLWVQAAGKNMSPGGAAYFDRSIQFGYVARSASFNLELATYPQLRCGLLVDRPLRGLAAMLEADFTSRRIPGPLDTSCINPPLTRHLTLPTL